MILQKQMKGSYLLPFVLLSLYLLLFVVAAIDPHDRATWWAENLPVMLAVAGLLLSWHWFQFSSISYVLMWLFLCYHTIGGHYTFALVPFEWGNKILSLLNMEFLLPTGRNNFDRLGHYLVGVFAYPVAELFYRKHWVKNIPTAVLLGILALGFWGALYEVIEMYFALLYGGESGAAFLGSQGDEWDAQKDMLMDILGAITVSIFFVVVWKRNAQHEHS
jgi:putative membrane protein